MLKLKNLWSYLLKHIIISGIIIIALAVGGYFAYQNFFNSKTTVSYVEGAVEKGTIISSISGTGQVSAENQVNLTAKASGDLTYLDATVGEQVKAGAVIARLDSTDVYKTVRDAQANLESAQLAMEKLKKAADPLTLLQSENSLAQAQESKDSAQANIDKAYEDAYNTISDTFLDLPTIIAGLYDTQYGNGIGIAEVTIGRSQDNSTALFNSTNAEEKEIISSLQTNAASDYNAARAKYDINFNAYKSATRFSDSATIEALLDQTLETTKAMAQSAKSESNLLDSWATYRTDSNWTVFTSVKTLQTNLGTYISQTGSHASSLLALKTTLVNNRTALTNADRSITEKTESLAQLKAGADPLDLRSQELSLEAKINSLADAREKYADYTITAPFDGVIASSDVKKGDSISSGATIATLITLQKIAIIPFNEVDIAKIKVGQKVNISFDALTDLTVVGLVAEVDTLGTVSQGVASYNVKIAFDVQDDRIKPGMTATVNIIIDSRIDVLIVPASAIKTANDGSSYVEVLLNGAPSRKSITVGLTDDTSTEVVSGLSEGDKIITQTVVVAAKTKAASASTGGSLNIMGAAGGAGASRAFQTGR